MKRVTQVLGTYSNHTNTHICTGVNDKQAFIVKFHLNRPSKEKDDGHGQ